MSFKMSFAQVGLRNSARKQSVGPKFSPDLPQLKSNNKRNFVYQLDPLVKILMWIWQ